MAATVETEVSEGKKRRAKKAQADKAGKSAKGKDGAASDRRAGRLKRMAEANTVTFVMETEVRKYINGEAKAAGMDLATAYEAIAISSGTSFVHETESQVILNGSRDISFTMDLVRKDIGLFQAVADRAGVPLEMNPLMIKIFEDGISRFGPRELSPNIIKRLEEATGLDITAPGFPPEMTDDEPEEPGYEVVPRGR